MKDWENAPGGPRAPVTHVDIDKLQAELAKLREELAQERTRRREDYHCSCCKGADCCDDQIAALHAKLAEAEQRVDELRVCRVERDVAMLDLIAAEKRLGEAVAVLRQIVEPTGLPAAQGWARLREYARAFLATLEKK